jgi:hypothetical protein
MNTQYTTLKAELLKDTKEEGSDVKRKISVIENKQRFYNTPELEKEKKALIDGWELRKINARIEGKKIDAQINGFAPVSSTEMVEYDEEESSRSRKLISAMASIVVTASTSVVFKSNPVTETAKKMYVNQITRNTKYANDYARIYANLQKGILEEGTNAVMKASSKMIDLPVDRPDEVQSCTSALTASAAVSDYNEVKTVIDKYLADASNLLKEQVSEKQLKRLIRNTGSGLLSTLNVDQRAIDLMQKYGFVDENFEAGQFNYRPPLFDGGIKMTPPPEFTNTWNKFREFACTASSSSEIDNAIGSYVDCRGNLPTFESSCPRLSNRVNNILNDAINPIEYNIQQYINVAARDTLQLQLDNVVDSSAHMVIDMLSSIVQLVVMYFIMLIVTKVRNSEKIEAKRKLAMLE